MKFLGWKSNGWLVSPGAAIALGEPLFRLVGMRGGQEGLDLSQVRRVLVVRLDEIGDVVMTSPFLRELRRNLPSAWVTLVVKPGLYNLVELCPYVDEVLTYNWDAPRLLRSLYRNACILRLAKSCLWPRRFDLAILPRWDTDYYHGTFLAYFSGARWRVGYSEQVNSSKQGLNKGLDRLLTHALKDSSLMHEVEYNLNVIRLLQGEVQQGHLELWVGKDDDLFAQAVWQRHAVVPQHLIVAFGPGAGAQKRQWPISSYKDLGLWLQRSYGSRLALIGGPGEEMLGDELEKELGPSTINLVGKTTLRQTAAVLRRVSLYVGSDAGPMHIAAAVGAPVVELSCHPETGSPYGSNSPSRFGPWCANRKIIQPRDPGIGCSEACVADVPHCILGISVDRVKKAVYDLLEARSIATGGRGAVGRNLGSPGGIPE